MLRGNFILRHYPKKTVPTRLKWDVCVIPRKQTSVSAAAMTTPDPNPFADCDVIVCYGNAKLTDKHLASTVHCVDDEIIGWLKRREQRRRDRLAGSRPSVYRYLP